MNRITIITGKTCTGKTTYAKLLVKEYESFEYRLLDEAPKRLSQRVVVLHIDKIMKALRTLDAQYINSDNEIFYRKVLMATFLDKLHRKSERELFQIVIKHLEEHINFYEKINFIVEGYQFQKYNIYPNFPSIDVKTLPDITLIETLKRKYKRNPGFLRKLFNPVKVFKELYNYFEKV